MKWLKKLWDVTFYKEFQVGNRLIIFEKRPEGWMSRFGGGWDYKIGVQWAGTTVIFSLLVMSVSFRPKN